MKDNWRSADAVGFETAHRQLGAFVTQREILSSCEISWLRAALPYSVQLSHDERFWRAFTILDQARWSATHEAAMMLIWMAIETLFDLGHKREKAKAISSALSSYISVAKPERDRTYQAVSSLYFHRGRIAHAGRTVSPEVVGQSFHLAGAAFNRVLTDGALPPSSGDRASRR
jgi:hypothetical protein